MHSASPLDDARRKALIDRWQEQDDVDALDELLRGEIDLLAQRLRIRGRGMFGASVSASDVAQDAVMRMLRLEETPHFESAQALRAYLWTAAWRLLLNYVQRPGRDVVRLDAQESGTLSRAFGTTGGLGHLDQSDQVAVLELMVNLLAPDDREVLRQVYFRGRAIDEVARELGLTRAAADMRLTRARRRLAERLVSWADVVE